jgi:two-component system NarL family sensor kinase
VQEALTNAVKHSHAKNVSIKLTRTNKKIQLDIQDDGEGTPIGIRFLQETSGLGIRNMQERIDSFDGRIQFSDVKPHGFGIRVTLPIEKDASKGSI